MITPAQYTALTDVIKQSCPEIMEPTCENSHNSLGQHFCTNCDDSFDTQKISLSHVLRTMQKAIPEKDIEKIPGLVLNVTVTSDGAFYDLLKRKPVTKDDEGMEVLKWPLETDDLSLASDETKQWLFSILVKEENI